jgi:hypothetical protein
VARRKRRNAKHGPPYSNLRATEQRAVLA